MSQKIAVIGPNGGIGGYVAAHLAKAINHGDVDGWELSGLVHSPQSLSAMTESGLTFYDAHPEQPGRHNEIHEKFTVSNDAQTLGPQDVIICATPADAIPVEAIAQMTKPGETRFIPCVNGLPFWYPALVDNVSGKVMETIDPDGEILGRLQEQGVLLVGSVTDVAGIKVGPGEVEGHPAIKDGQFVHGQIHLGAVNDAAEVADLVALFNDSGIVANHLKDSKVILRQVWVKIAGNVAANYGAMIQDQAIPELLTDEQHAAFYREAIDETLRVGLPDMPDRMREKIVDRIIAAKIELKGHFTSTHASFANGDPTCERQAIIDPVLALADERGVDIPNVRQISGQVNDLLGERDRLMSQQSLSSRDAANQARRNIIVSP